MAVVKKQPAQKRVLAYSLADDSDIGMMRYSSLEEVAKDSEIINGEFDDSEIAVWELIGTYKVKRGPATLEKKNGK